MGRPRDHRLPDSLARSFRDDVNRRLKRNKVARQDLLHSVDSYPERSESWISRALSGSDLSWLAAVELAVRVHHHGITLTKSILDQIATFELEKSTAIVLVHTGDSERLAHRLATRAGRIEGISAAMQCGLEKLILQELKRFERFNDLPIAKRIWALMQVHSVNARAQFFRDINHVSVDGNEWTTPGEIGILRRLARDR